MHRNLCLIFTSFNLEHCSKDVGNLPYYFNRVYGYNSKIVTYNNNPEIIEKAKVIIPNVKIEFLKKAINFRFIDLRIVKYIIQNSRNIDLLIMFHFNINVVLSAFIYKIIKPSGFCYVRLDFHQSAPNASSRIMNESKRNRTKLKNFLLKIFSRSVNIWSSQDETAIDYLLRKYNIFDKKIVLSYNGINTGIIKDLKIRIKKYEEKENIISNVGRLGSYAKATEILMESITLLPRELEWKFCFAGPEEENFKEFKNIFLQKNYNLVEKCIFLGELDKEKLFDLYNRSKIFCLTSRYEGMALVIPEAMYFKNAIITTNVGGAKISVNDNKSGKLIPFDDPQRISEVLLDVISDEKWLMQAGEISHSIAIENLDWNVIINKLWNDFRLIGMDRDTKNI